MMRISQRDTDGVLILELRGKAVAGIAEQRFKRAVEAAIARGRSRILCNLERVTAIDAAGVGRLVSASVEAREAGGELKLLDPSLAVTSVLILFGLGDMFSIVRSGRELASAFARSERLARTNPPVPYRPFDSRGPSVVQM